MVLNLFPTQVSEKPIISFFLSLWVIHCTFVQRGEKGYVGPTGTVGWVGPPGIPGTRGDVGPPGDMGVKGYSGPKGNPGEPVCTA